MIAPDQVHDVFASRSEASVGERVSDRELRHELEPPTRCRVTGRRAHAKLAFHRLGELLEVQVEHGKRNRVEVRGGRVDLVRELERDGLVEEQLTVVGRDAAQDDETAGRARTTLSATAATSDEKSQEGRRGVPQEGGVLVHRGFLEVGSIRFGRTEVEGPSLPGFVEGCRCGKMRSRLSKAETGT